MNKIATKRKSKEEESAEMVRPRKRLKISEIIQKNIVDEENSPRPFNRNIISRRNKLLTAMHLKKRYKYYCKKHGITYLVESARERVKNASKESRDKFIQSFRTLRVSTNSRASISQNSVCIANKDKDSSKHRDNSKNNQIQFSTNVTLLKENPPAKLESSLLNLQKNSTENSAMFEKANEEDSDFADDYEDAYFRKRKIVKCLIVKKNSASNIIFSEDEDFSESDFDDENSDCDCYYHENFKNNFHNYEYESSSDDDAK